MFKYANRSLLKCSHALSPMSVLPLMCVWLVMLIPVKLSAQESITQTGLSQQVLRGTKQIQLLDKNNEPRVIGHIEFTVAEDKEGSHYRLHLDEQPFQDYFLSMKEMKCLEGPELWCHLAYPYQQPRWVSNQDLRWLSHDLLFMFKKKADFGANFWNGIYYQLRVEQGVIVGDAQAVDLNLLASPPDDPRQPPITPGELYEIDSDKRWLPGLRIM